MRSLLLGTLSALVLAGCAEPQQRDRTVNVPLRIYNVDNGDVFLGQFRYTGYQGSVTANLPSGQLCTGDYFTQDNSVTSSSSGWGTIYRWGSNNFTNVSTSTSETILPGSMAGTAILRCEDRNVIQCEYTVNRRNQGAGFCKDNQRGRYRFVF